MKKIYTLLAIILLSSISQGQVVISQIYGGGGNGGATYTNDFIELFNRGTVAQNLSGWSVQYASANGSTWFVTQLPSFVLQPGKYFLIQEDAGTTPVLALPTPDLDGITCGCTYNTATPPVVIATGIAMSAANGKVILVSSTVAESTANPTGSQIIDKVAFGTTSTSGFEGTGPTGTTLTSSTSAQRNNGGCTDTNSNPTDFTAATPIPRNSATPTNDCSLGTNENTISGLNVFVNNKNLFVTSDSSSDKQVLVYDITGKQVLNTTTDGQGISVSELASGVYVVKVNEEGKTATKKLVIR